jgi:hypothetical protein
MSTKTLTLLAQGTAATAGDKTAVESGVTPFLPGRKVRAKIFASGQTGTAPAWAIDGSDDNSTWTADLMTSAVVDEIDQAEITCYKYMRASVTTAAGTTAGTLHVWLEGLG